MNLEERIADSTEFSETGHKITAGESYFIERKHGREIRHTTLETEQLLGLRDFSGDQRKKLAKKGSALPDGSFPIMNCSDAMNARRAIGRANPADRSKVRAHIRSRERALGCNNGGGV
jgi:hypothetical protein